MPISAVSSNRRCQQPREVPPGVGKVSSSFWLEDGREISRRLGRDREDGMVSEGGDRFVGMHHPGRAGHATLSSIDLEGRWSLNRHVLMLLSLMAVACVVGEVRGQSNEAPPADEEIQDLLADPPEGHPELADDNPYADLLTNDPATVRGSTFGAQLSFLNLETSLSGYGDVVYLISREGNTFNASHFNPIFTSRLGETVSAELELEVEGALIKAEYGFLDFSRDRRLLVRVGKFLVPIGRFNEILHPSFRWDMVSRPLMFLEVSPSVWSNTGIQVQGHLSSGPTATFDYALYVINGFAADSGFTENDEIMRDTRSNPVDNNRNKGVGALGRVRLREGRPGASSLGVSAHTGAVDPAQAWRFSAVNIDFATSYGGVLIEGEVSQSFLSFEEQGWLTPFERGLYVKVGYGVGKVTTTVRWDYALTRPALGEPVSAQQGVLSVRYAPSPFWSVRVEGSVPVTTDFVDQSRLALMVAFSY